ncbi:hypothetical protein F5984_00670 [Rudanella paleaurantiibacter]|uniref:SbsA Ig-like domain-containing protein n=1 Tax=Rudanella paleaurantiibacter TaxID=2614655 RepID=A0A7J5U3T7_9BACT|nr:Ig-like domain-containing protein [Rudanella paleaurantiibacter]KAB7732508.1 hypothetical protein F5984_00670 [Rudanella paleaurantiibacter]
MSLRISFFLVLLSLPFLLQNCAQVANPPGGKKDTLAPKLVSSIPKNRQLNVQGKTIELLFDEYVSAENLQQKILITPQDTNPFVVRQLPQGFRLVFNQNFKPNTTYTISFADAIRDVTERNVAENPKLVFSTGPAIDSLRLGGTILDADTKQPILGMVVGLFAPDDTLPVQRKRPQYFARTDSNGVYLIENIKTAAYKPFAFEDKDLNLVNNQPGERVAFRDSLVNLNRNYDDVNLVAFRGYVKPRITRRERTDETMGLELSSGIASYRLQPQIPSSSTLTPVDSVISFLERPTLIRIYKPEGRAAGDTIPVLITTIDSVGNANELRERLYFSPLKSRARDRVVLGQDVDPKSGEAIDNNQVFTVTFNKPIKTLTPDLIRIYRSDSTKALPASATSFSFSNGNTRLTITARTNIADTLNLLFRRGAFMSIQNDTSARARLQYRVLNTEDFGLISGQVNRPTGEKFIVELTDENYKVIRSVANTPNYVFARLKPGRYRVRLILDRNGNGRRDTGNIQKLIQPEEIIYHPGFQKGIIPLKADFELGDINF